MDEIHITFFQYIPLIDIVYSDNVRDGLVFFSNGLKTTAEIEKSYKNRQKNSRYPAGKAKVEEISIRNYSNLSWSWTGDGFNYYRNVRKQIFDNQPIRPLIALSTKSIKWIIDERNVNFLQATKRIELSNSLNGIIQKKVTFKIQKDIRRVFHNYLKLTVQQCNKEKGIELGRILRGVFKTSEGINVDISDTISCIEISKNNFEKIILNFNKKAVIKSQGVFLYVDGFNKIYIVYEKTPHKILRRRIIKVVSLVFGLKFLLRRMIYLLDYTFQDLGLREKTDVIEYILSTLNPENYSSKDQRLDLLLNHYQRVIFNRLAAKIQIDTSFQHLKEKIKSKIEKTPTYEVCYLFARNNIFTNRLKNELTIELEEKLEPDLSFKEKIILDFFVVKYTQELEDEGLVQMQVTREQPLGLITRNHIRTNINNWLKKMNLPTGTFTETELKKKPLPDVISSLEKKDLVRIFKKVKGKADFHLYLNDENMFVKKRIYQS